jgi:outer membrane protein insertion porin family
VPFYERYYLGGQDTLRGFRYRSVGPREDGSGNEPIGGNTYYFGYAEYSVPLIQTDTERGVGVRLAVFYDIGNVMRQSYSWDSNYSDNWGIGLRLNLPIGPLRLDYGIPMNFDRRHNTGSGRFQFGVGYRRDF